MSDALRNCGCPPGFVCFNCEPTARDEPPRHAAIRVGTQPAEGAFEVELDTAGSLTLQKILDAHDAVASIDPTAGTAAQEAAIVPVPRIQASLLTRRSGQTLSREQQLVELWLHGRSPHTQRAYRTEWRRFIAFAGKSLLEVTLGDLQDFADYLQKLHLAPGSRHRAISAVKSLFAFGARLGYLPFDVARPLKMPSGKDTLNERILDEAAVCRLIAGETNGRNRLMLQLLYVAGVRVSELVALTWRDLQSRRGGGQITVLGKGRKTRTIVLEGAIWQLIEASRVEAINRELLNLAESVVEFDHLPVFVSRRRGHLHPSQVLRIVRAAARRAGISQDVSTHWLRHCHASHALDRGAPIHLVQATLGHSSVATTSRYLHARPTESSSKFLPPV
jgi:integrase/recombinase XerD